MMGYTCRRAIGAAFALAFATPAIAQPVPISNGSQFATNTGAPVQAHGAGIIKVGSYYYLFGENRSNYLFKAVSMYRSTDLKRWEFRRDVLTPASDPRLDPSNIERPKIIYNAATGKYVLWAHKENGINYNEARVIVATSSTIDGDYTLVGEFRPLDYSSRDMGMFVDADGSAYLISATRSNYDLNIYKLNASFTGIDALVTTLVAYHREAPALFRRGGTYFLVTSGATGWNPNQAAYQTATSLAGPWTRPVPFGDARTYNSQSTFVLPIQGTAGTSYLYMGDQWGPAFAMKPNDSSYVWLPLTFPSATSVAMTGSSQITVDVAAGTVGRGWSGTTLVQLRAQSSGLCLNVADNALTYGAAVIQWDCASYRNMQLERRPVAGGYTQYVFQHSGLCLAQKDGGSEAVQTPCGVGARAEWTLAGTNIVNRESGRCLNVSGDSRTRGGEVITYPCSASANSQWQPS